MTGHTISHFQDYQDADFVTCPQWCYTTALWSLPLSLLHAQYLYEPDEDVDEVQLQADTLVNCIPLNQATLGKSCTVQDSLYIVKGEAAENRQTAIQPEVLCEGQGSDRCHGKHKRGKTTERNNCDATKEWCSKIQVLLLLSSGANKCDGTLALC